MKTRIKKLESKIREIQERLHPSKMTELLIVIRHGHEERPPEEPVIQKLVLANAGKPSSIWGMIHVPDDVTAEEMQKLKVEFDSMKPEKL